MTCKNCDKIGHNSRTCTAPKKGNATTVLARMKEDNNNEEKERKRTMEPGPSNAKFTVRKKVLKARSETNLRKI